MSGRSDQWPSLILRVPAHAAAFELLRDLASRAAQIAGLDETTSVLVAQAVERAARQTLSGGSDLELRLEDRGAELAVEIESCGTGPEATRPGGAAAAPETDGSSDGVMDSVSFERISRGIRCRLIKRKPEESETGHGGRG